MPPTRLTAAILGATLTLLVPDLATGQTVSIGGPNAGRRVEYQPPTRGSVARDFTRELPRQTKNYFVGAARGVTSVGREAVRDVAAGARRVGTAIANPRETVARSGAAARQVVTHPVQSARRVGAGAREVVASQARQVVAGARSYRDGIDRGDAGSAGEVAGRGLGNGALVVAPGGAGVRGYRSVRSVSDTVRAVEGHQRLTRSLRDSGMRAGTIHAEVYGDVRNPRAGARFTDRQRQDVLQMNRFMNNGELRSEPDRRERAEPRRLVRSQQSRRGVRHEDNEAVIDHYVPRARQGTNSYRNARVLGRDENLRRSDRFERQDRYERRESRLERRRERRERIRSERD
jgi:hypothetical protein